MEPWPELDYAQVIPLPDQREARPERIRNLVSSGATRLEKWMSERTADLFVSLDGFASAEVGPYFDYDGPELQRWTNSELDKPQLVVLGLVTYEELAAMSTKGSDRLAALPKAVVSSTLSEPLKWANTRLVTGDAIETLPAVKADSDVPLRTMGSLSLVASLMDAGLVDRLRLMLFPLTCRTAGHERIFRRGKLDRYELQHTSVVTGGSCRWNTGRARWPTLSQRCLASRKIGQSSHAARRPVAAGSGRGRAADWASL